MKRFISALTAFCMAASMTVATIPASAVNLSEMTAVNAQADTWGWGLEDVTYDPATDKNVEINVILLGTDPGTYGYEYTGLLIDGKSIADSDFRIVSVKQADGGAYNFGMFQASKETGHVGAAENAKEENSYGADGAKIVTYKLALKDGVTATPGKVYTAEITGLEVGNTEKVKSTPPVSAGSITIAGSGDTPTEAKTEAKTDAPDTPTQAPDTPTEAPTEKVETPTNAPKSDKSNLSDWTWYFDDVTYNPTTEKNVEISVLVGGPTDPGTYGFDFGMTIDGKAIADSDFKIVSITKGTAYGFGMFQGNKEDGSVGAAENAKENDTVATAGQTVATYKLKLKDGVTAAPGKVYSVEITNLSCGNAKKEKFTPNTLAGSIEIVGDSETPTDAPDNPTDAPENPTDAPENPTDAPENPTDAPENPTDAPENPTDAPENPTVAPYTEKTSEVDAKWDIAEVECKAGATVEVPVKITGNVGFNSFIAAIKADAGPSAAGADAGAGFANLNMATNKDKLTFAGTDFKSGKDQTGDGDVFIMQFTVPADAAPGTVYKLDFASLDVFNIDMVKLIPQTAGGSITITDGEFVDTSEAVSGTWKIGEKTVKVGTTTAELPITVTGMTAGINSYIAQLDTTLKATDAKGGDAYAKLGFAGNPGALKFGATDSADKTDITGEGDVFYVTFEIPADAKAGDKFPVDWASLELRNIDMVKLVPTLENGWIMIEEEPTEAPTEATTEAPTEAPTIPVEAGDAGEWIIGNDEVEAGATVTIPVTIKGMKVGLNSYIMKMGVEEVDGGKPIITEAANGNAFETIGFVYNKDNASFGGTGMSEKTNMLAADGSTVFNVTFKVPDDAKPGTVYNLTFEDLEVIDIDMTARDAIKTPGFIKIKDAPTEAPTDTTLTTEAPTDATGADVTEDWEDMTYAVTWDIEDEVVAKPGQQKVPVKVTINGDTLLNSFIAAVRPDDSINYNSFDPGKVYGSSLTIYDNATDPGAIKFAGSCGDMAPYLDGKNGVVMTMYFDVPETAADGSAFTDGDILPIKWLADQFEIQRHDGAKVIPTLLDGSIVIRADEVVKYEYSYEYSAEGNDKFYFSHDPRPFDLAELNGKLYRQGVKADGTKVGEPVEVNVHSVDIVMSAYNLTGEDGAALTNPKAIFESGAGKAADLAYCMIPLQVEITDVLPNGEDFVATLTPDSETPFIANAFIGVKGDTDLNGVCNASDAAKVLIFAATYGASTDPASVTIAEDSKLENFVYFLSDVDGESEDHGKTTAAGAETSPVNASDAAKQLIYAAVKGASSAGLCDWAVDVFKENNLPLYTNEIHEWEKAHQ